ncbi:MAG: Sugar or nucleoside kinase, ribokinase family [Rhodoglobus sp.]|nr:Sugar or nucleoside kinase, ribokinase family [Rhodoglobus sp.]
MKVVYLGSAKIDIETAIPSNFPTLGDVYELGHIKVAVGGTAGGFAESAGHLFEEFEAIAAIGDDRWSDEIEAHLRRHSARAHLHTIEGTPNATVLVVRSQDGGGAPSRRLLVSSLVSPHRHLTADIVREYADVIHSADVFITDTYFLQSLTATEGLRAALEIARPSAAVSVLDLLPHSLPDTHTLAQVEPLIELADVIVSEARTLVGLGAGRWDPAPQDQEDLIARAREIVHRYGDSSTWIIRYGASHIENTAVKQPGRDWIEYCSLYRHADKRGYGDKLLASDLRAFIKSD